MKYDELKKYLEDHAGEIMDQTGAHIVGIGKNDAGEDILNIYVEDPPTDLATEALQKFMADSVRIPFQYVVEKPAQADILYVDDMQLENKDFGRYRPLIGGIQIHLRKGGLEWYGTLGTFVKSKDTTDDSLYLLSNKHVLDTVGLGVCQPLFCAGNTVAIVSQAKEYKDTDAALAEVLDPSDVDVNLIEEIGRVTETKSITEDDVGKQVLKRGRTTYRTVGTIEDAYAVVKVDGIPRYDCVIVRANKGELFSSPGDSGSPVVMKDDRKLVGLHFAGNGTSGGISIFCKIDNVFNNYNIKLPD